MRLGFVVLGFLVACSGAGGSGELAVRLTDAPGPYDAVTVELAALSAHVSDHTPGAAAKIDDASTAGSTKGWITIAVPRKTIDLLKLQNGAELALGNASVPAGSYDALRLVVDSATVVVNGLSLPLAIPAGDASGITVKYAFTVGEGDRAELLLDFDANASIHPDGAGHYLMSPVISIARETHAR